MVNFLCTPPISRIGLTVAMETMDFFIVQLSLSLRTKILCISGVPMNDLAPMKNFLGVQGSRGIRSILREHIVSRVRSYFPIGGHSVTRT